MADSCECGQDCCDGHGRWSHPSSPRSVHDAWVAQTCAVCGHPLGNHSVGGGHACVGNPGCGCKGFRTAGATRAPGRYEVKVDTVAEERMWLSRMCTCGHNRGRHRASDPHGCTVQTAPRTYCECRGFTLVADEAQELLNAWDKLIGGRK